MQQLINNNNSIMRTIKLLLVSLILSFVSTNMYADGIMIPVEQLPQAAKSFVQKNFPNNTIIYAEKEMFSYEARLDDGTEIDFDRKGNWDKVDCKLNAVPSAIIPAPILNYVQKTFPNAEIVKIDKERHGYDIELSNDIELKFNKKGAFMGMDD